MVHLGFPITHGSDAHYILAATKPAVAILATRSFLKELAEPLKKIIAENQVNVITIGEESVYSWNTEPALTQELDAFFRKNAVTLTDTGYQDAYWIYLASVLVGVTFMTNRLVCHTQFN